MLKFKEDEKEIKKEEEKNRVERVNEIIKSHDEWELKGFQREMANFSQEMD